MHNRVFWEPDQSMPSIRQRQASTAQEEASEVYQLYLVIELPSIQMYTYTAHSRPINMCDFFSSPYHTRDFRPREW